jgi:hypothetical protein
MIAALTYTISTTLRSRTETLDGSTLVNDDRSDLQFTGLNL